MVEYIIYDEAGNLCLGCLIEIESGFTYCKDCTDKRWANLIDKMVEVSEGRKDCIIRFVGEERKGMSTMGTTTITEMTTKLNNKDKINKEKIK